MLLNLESPKRRRARRAPRPAMLGALGLILGLLAQVGLASPASAAACASGTDFTITPVHSPIFYSDPGDNLSGMYVGYAITNDGVSTVDDLWVSLDSFLGGEVGLAADEDGVVQLGTIAAGTTGVAYFYLATSAAGDSSVDQTFDVNLFDARPDLAGATELCDSADLFTDIDSVISANSNKVTTVVAGPSPAELGGEMTITVTGDTGTVGAAGIFAASPAAYPDWPANAYQMIRSEITFADLGLLATDELFLTGISKSEWIAVYTFIATGVTTSPTAVSPIANISSGTQIKHTSTGGYDALAPVQPADNNLSISKDVAPNLFASGTGGTSTYTVTLTNSGSTTVGLNDLVDTFPAGTTYAGTQTFNGSPIPAPSISGQEATFVGPFSVPGGGTSTLTYDLSIPAVDGTYVNSAVGHIGLEQIDLTELTTDDVPATAAVTVGDPPVDLSVATTSSPVSAIAGQNLTYTIQVSNAGPGDAVDVVSTETLPAGVTFVSSSGCAEDPAGVPTCSLGTINAGSSASYTVTVAVDAGAGGTLSNTVSVATSGDDIDDTNDSFTLNTPVTTDITLGLAENVQPQHRGRRNHRPQLRHRRLEHGHF